MRHLKYKPGSIILLRQLDARGEVTTVWGGQVVASTPEAMTVLGIEMTYQKEKWHCVGEFREITAPPHRLPRQWDFPRLLVTFEANDTDLKARPVIESALEVYRQQQSSK